MDIFETIALWFMRLFAVGLPLCAVGGLLGNPVPMMRPSLLASMPSTAFSQPVERYLASALYAFVGGYTLYHSRSIKKDFAPFGSGKKRKGRKKR